MAATLKEIILMEHAKRQRRQQANAQAPGQNATEYGIKMALALARGDSSVLNAPPNAPKDDEKAPS